MKMKYKGGIRVKHMLSRTYIYTCWRNILSRCLNDKDHAYQNYGGRGIKVCAYFRESPANLLRFLGDRTDSMTVERIDNDSGYTCGTCDECLDNKWRSNLRWATRTHQARNRRSNRLITIRGVTKTISEWCESENINTNSFYSRIMSGDSGEELIRPINLKKRNHRAH